MLSMVGNSESQLRYKIYYCSKTLELKLLLKCSASHKSSVNEEESNALIPNVYSITKLELLSFGPIQLKIQNNNNKAIGEITNKEEN